MQDNCECIEFVPNFFKRSKCSNCFHDVEQHLNSGKSKPEPNKFWAAADAEDMRVIAEQIRCGIDVNTPNAAGDTALMIACVQGHFSVIDYLVKFAKTALNVNYSNAWGWTALMIASAGGHLAIVKHLVKYCHADVDVQRDNGYTAIMEATKYGHIGIIQFLTAAGAKLVTESREGRLHILKIRSYGATQKQIRDAIRRGNSDHGYIVDEAEEEERKARDQAIAERKKARAEAARRKASLFRRTDLAKTTQLQAKKEKWKRTQLATLSEETSQQKEEMRKKREEVKKKQLRFATAPNPKYFKPALAVPTGHKQFTEAPEDNDVYVSHTGDEYVKGPSAEEIAAEEEKKKAEEEEARKKKEAEEEEQKKKAAAVATPSYYAPTNPDNPLFGLGPSIDLSTTMYGASAMANSDNPLFGLSQSFIPEEDEDESEPEPEPTPAPVQPRRSTTRRSTKPRGVVLYEDPNTSSSEEEGEDEEHEDEEVPMAEEAVVPEPVRAPEPEPERAAEPECEPETKQSGKEHEDTGRPRSHTHAEPETGSAYMAPRPASPRAMSTVPKQAPYRPAHKHNKTLSSLGAMLAGNSGGLSYAEALARMTAHQPMSGNGPVLDDDDDLGNTTDNEDGGISRDESSMELHKIVKDEGARVRRRTLFQENFISADMRIAMEKEKNRLRELEAQKDDPMNSKRLSMEEIQSLRITADNDALEVESPSDADSSD